MSTNDFTVTCRRRSGQWEIRVPEVPDLALFVDRLEDVPAAARQAIARGIQLDERSVRVLLDVRGR
ncbi:MAG: hypothetical protein QOJ03_1334 [Frankiaceae bacterium]|jgi:hypothetical protein|nr:hypothetical protein [Frankiaceae bacterium]